MSCFLVVLWKILQEKRKMNFFLLSDFCCMSEKQLETLF